LKNYIFFIVCSGDTPDCQFIVVWQDQVPVHTLYKGQLIELDERTMFVTVLDNGICLLNVNDVDWPVTKSNGLIGPIDIL